MTSHSDIGKASASSLESFKGAKLTSVNVWKFGVTLGFNNEPRTITVENGIELRSQGRTESYNQEVVVAFGARILALMNRRIIELRTTEEKVLSFEFDEGSILTLRPDGTGYESYTINLPDGSVFVG